ncbi:MAG: rRNA pseudouridine synthase [Firmicutes bacterium]|nr:rRNA pseudouridine synthase [Bacillota bacterium]
MKERLQKVIAQAGLASRRRAEELILSGRVKVNDTVVTKLGCKVDPMIDVVSIDDHVLPVQEQKTYILLYKPVGYVTTVSDPYKRPTVLDLVPNPKRLFPVGRLDINSEGLLLLTNDGTLAHLLMHPRFGVTKTYEVWIKGQLSADKLQQLTTGIQLEDGPARAIKVSLVGSWSQGSRWKVVMGEGRKREIRRMFLSIGAPVQRLIRRNLGPLSLGQLTPGQFRPLTKAEVVALYQAAGQPCIRHHSKITS